MFTHLKMTIEETPETWCACFRSHVQCWSAAACVAYAGVSQGETQFGLLPIKALSVINGVNIILTSQTKIVFWSEFFCRLLNELAKISIKRAKRALVEFNNQAKIIFKKVSTKF